MSVAGINYALVITNQNKDTTLVESRPVFDNQCIDCLLQRNIKVGQVEILSEAGAMQRLIIRK
jgi:hypothetical protein